jgi:hypothetical protein
VTTYTPEQQAFLNSRRIAPSNTEERPIKEYTPEQQAFLNSRRMTQHAPEPSETGQESHEQGFVENLSEGVLKGASRGLKTILSKAAVFGQTPESTEGVPLEERLTQQKAEKVLESLWEPGHFEKEAEGFGGTVERFIGEEFPSIVEDAVLTAANPALMTTMFLARQAGKGAKAATTGLGFSEEAGEKAQFWTTLLTSVFAPTRVKQVADKLYNTAKTHMSKLEPIAATELQALSRAGETALRSPELSARAASAIEPAIQRFKKVFSTKASKRAPAMFHEAKVEDLIAQKKIVTAEVNKVLKNPKLSKSERKAAQQALFKFNDDINKTIFSVKGPGADQFVKYQQAADAAYATVAQNPVMNKTVTSLLKRGGKRFGLTNSAISLHVAHSLGLLGSVAKATKFAGAAGAAAIAPFAAKAVFQRVMKNSDLRKHYFKAMAYKAAMNAEKVAEEIAELTKKLESERSESGS